MAFEICFDIVDNIVESEGTMSTLCHDTLFQVSVRVFKFISRFYLNEGKAHLVVSWPDKYKEIPNTGPSLSGKQNANISASPFPVFFPTCRFCRLLWNGI